MRLRTTLALAFVSLSILQVMAVVPLALRNLNRTLSRQLETRIDGVMKAANSSLERTASESTRAMDELAGSDAFEKVYSFYKSLYKEIAVPFRQTTPTGKEVKWAFFVLDGGKDLMHSNYWMKVQRPYIGTVDDEANFQDVREMSVIQTVRRHAPAFKRSRLLDISDRH